MLDGRRHQRGIGFLGGRHVASTLLDSVHRESASACARAIEILFEVPQ